MSKSIFIPETFRDRPYARQLFTKQVEWMCQHHPFYQLHTTHPEIAIPLIQRDHILEDNDLFLNGYPETDATSGSTGIRVRISWSKDRAKLENKDNRLIKRWLGGYMPRIDIVSLAGHKKTPTTMEINSPLDQQIDFIHERHQTMGAVSLLTYPTNLEILCKYIIENQIDMKIIKRIICISETFETRLDQLAGIAFPNATVWPSYSCSEVGKISFRCPTNPNNHHVMAHKLGIEVLNDDNQPCQLGETGRIVITDYFNKRSPFIRYDIGDLAAPAICDCKLKQYPALQTILGKVRGLLKHRDGHKLMFTDLSMALRKIPGIRQFQVIQEQLETFLVRYVPNERTKNMIHSNDQSTTESLIQKAFQENFGYLPQIQFTIETRIEREANGKYYASKCLVHD